MPPTIRALTTDDATAFMAVRGAALAHEPFAFSASPEDDLASSSEFVRAAFERRGQATFGAFDPHLIGIVGVRRDRQVKGAHRAHVWGMYVVPERRREGVGRGLLEAAVRFARSLSGVSRVNLSVSTTATAALALYERMGFVAWGTEPAAMEVGGRQVAEHHMTLVL